MRSWLTYIFLSMATCGALLTSCSNVLDEEGIVACDDRTTVRLTISFGGNDDPMSRDVGSDPAPEDDDLDYTIKKQAEIVTGDVYALVVDATSNKFLYRIKDLHLEEPDTYDNYYTRTLEGTMIQTNESVKIVLLANLVQNDITIDGTALDSKADVEAFIDKNEGENVNVNTIYNQLIYNYDGTTTPWTLTGEKARRIPMWGESQSTTVPPTESIDLACYLYRAVAKVQIWVNKKKGIQDADGNKLTIQSITFSNVHTKGYCVSQADFDSNTIADGVKPYAAPYPYVPLSTESYHQSVTYTSLDVTDAFSDMIYLPENDNDTNPIYMDFTYSFGESLISIKIPFGEDIIRNYSYIFNINKNVNGEIVVNYLVTDWETGNIKVPSFE